MPIEEDLFDPEAKDQLAKERGICLTKNCDVRKYWKILDACQKRVLSKEYTAETCHEETVDLMMAVDHCVGDKAFAKMK